MGEVLHWVWHVIHQGKGLSLPLEMRSPLDTREQNQDDGPGAEGHGAECAGQAMGRKAEQALEISLLIRTSP